MLHPPPEHNDAAMAGNTGREDDACQSADGGGLSPKGISQPRLEIGLENKEDIHADIEALRARQEDERAAKRVKTTQQRSAAMSANQAAGVLQGMR